MTRVMDKNEEENVGVKYYCRSKIQVNFLTLLFLQKNRDLLKLAYGCTKLTFQRKYKTVYKRKYNTIFVS